MKDTEIHNNLQDKEIRDFLASTLVDIWAKTKEVKSINILNRVDMSPHQYSYEFHLSEAKKHTELANLSQQTMAILSIIKSKGWDEFDVSDQVSRSDYNKLYRNFIGTQEEHDKIFKVV